jgi:hypothetical protein
VKIFQLLEAGRQAGMHDETLSEFFLGAFAKLRKSTITFVMSVWVFVRPTGRIFMNFGI